MPASPLSRAERFRGTLWVLLFQVVIGLPGLGLLEARGEEATRILPAITMLETGDWLRPELAGRPYDNKPPFINWSIALTLTLTGESAPAAGRLASVLWSLIFALFVLHAAGPWFGLRARLLVVATWWLNAAMIEKTRLAEIEATYVALTGIALVLFVRAWSLERRGWRLFLPPALPLALAMLTKGPAHLLFFEAAIVGLAWRSGARSRLVHPAHLVALGLSVAPFLLWAMLAPESAGEADRARTRWVDEIAQRFAADDADPLAWAGRVLSGIALAAPGLLLVPRVIRARGGAIDSRALAGLALGATVAAVLVAALPGVRSRYLFPLFPALALAIGHAAATGLPHRAERIGIHALSLILALGLLGLHVAGILAWRADPGTLFWGVLLALVATAVIREATRVTTLLRGASVILGLVGLLALSSVIWTPELAAKGAQRAEHGRRIAAELSAGETLHVWRPARLSFLLYLPRPLRAIEEGEDHLLEEARWLLVRRKQHEELLATSPRIASAEIRLAVPPRIRGEWLLLRLDS